MSELDRAIAGQADAVAAMLEADLGPAAERLAGTRHLWLVGTGTSEHAAELGTWMFCAGERTVRASSSARFSWLADGLGPGDGVVVISHTGETALARRARALARAAGAPLVSITARGVGWPEAVQTIPRERSETYTASYLAALVVLARLSLALGQSSLAAGDLNRLPGAVRAAAERPFELGLEDRRVIALAGVGPGAVSAREGALKLREAARALAEGYEAEYLLHGSAVPLGAADALLALQPTHDPVGLLGRLMAAAAREGVSTATIEEPGELGPVLAQIPLTVRLQRLAADLARARGLDPDIVITGAWADAALWSAGAPDDAAGRA